MEAGRWRGVSWVEGSWEKTDQVGGGVQWAIGREDGPREDRTAGQPAKAENQERSLERAVQELGVAVTRDLTPEYERPHQENDAPHSGDIIHHTQET